MAVVSAREINKGRSGGINREGDTEYVRQFLIQVDNPHDNAATIMATGSLPSWLSVFSAGGVTDLSARARDIRCQPRDEQSPYWWDVTIKYDSRVEPGEKLEHPDSESVEDNPLNRPPRDRWETHHEERVSDRDYLDKPFTNSAGVMYKEGLVLEETYPKLVIVRNEPVEPGEDVVVYNNSINTDTFRGKGQYKWKCVDITSSDGEEQIGGFTVFYSQVRYEFALKDDDFGWVRRILNKGAQQLKQNLVNGQLQTELECKRDAHGAIVQEEFLLDQFGAFLLLTRGGDLAGGQVPSYKTFVVNRPRPFSFLGL